MTKYDAPIFPSEVKSAEEERTVNAVLVEATKYVRDIEEKRKLLVAPHNAKVKEINDAAKTMKADAEEAIRLCGTLLNGWRTSQEFVRLAQEREVRLMDAQKAAMADDMESLPQKVEEYDRARALAPKSVQSGDAATSFRTEIIVDSVDETVLPDKYFVKTVNLAQIKKDLKTGEIAGVKYHVEKKAVVRQF